MMIGARRLKMIAAAIIVCCVPSWTAAAAQNNRRSVRHLFHQAFGLIHATDGDGKQLQALGKALQEEPRLARMKCPEWYSCGCCDGTWDGATLLMVAVHKKKLGCVRVLLENGASTSVTWEESTIFDLAEQSVQGITEYIAAKNKRLQRDRSLDDEGRSEIKLNIRAAKHKLAVASRIKTVLEGASVDARRVLSASQPPSLARQSLADVLQEKIAQESKAQRNREKRLRQKMRRLAEQEAEQKRDEEPEGPDIVRVSIFSDLEQESDGEVDASGPLSTQDIERVTFNPALSAKLSLDPRVYMDIQQRMAGLLYEKKSHAQGR